MRHDRSRHRPDRPVAHRSRAVDPAGRVRRTRWCFSAGTSASAEQLAGAGAGDQVVAARPPLMMIDRGGRTRRPPAPSDSRTAEREAFGEGEKPAELSEWLGRVIGMALRYFDIEMRSRAGGRHPRGRSRRRDWSGGRSGPTRVGGRAGRRVHARTARARDGVVPEAFPRHRHRHRPIRITARR